MDQIISFITLLLLTLLGLAIEVIGFIDALLGSALTSLGVPASAQPPLLIIAAILLAVAAFQLLGRFVGFLLLVLFLLLLLHPHMPPEWRHMSAPPALNLPGPHVTM
jgi:hypothetical protein